MAHLIQIETAKTYATRENAIAAVERLCGPDEEHFGSAEVRYLIAVGEDGRFFPVFIGESAIRHGLHFKFAVAA